MTRMRSRDREDLVQIGRDDEDGAARVAHLDQRAVDRFDRADIDALRGLLGNDQPRSRASVRARSAPSADCRPRANRRVLSRSAPRTSKLPDQFARPPACLADRRRTGRGVNSSQVADRHVLPDRAFAARARRRRDRPEYRQGRPRDWRAGVAPQRRAADATSARDRTAQAGDALDQFVLAIALDAGEADDLAGAGRASERSSTAVSPRSPSAVRPLDVEQRFRRRAGPSSLATRSSTERPTIRLGDLLRR